MKEATEKWFEFFFDWAENYQQIHKANTIPYGILKGMMKKFPNVFKPVPDLMNWREGDPDEHSESLYDKENKVWIPKKDLEKSVYDGYGPF